MHHIIGGFSAAGSLRHALPRSSGHIYFNEDMLSCGPAIRTDELKTWRSHRERFVQEIYGEPEYKFGIDNKTTRKLCLIDHVERLLISKEPATIWAAAGLADQLFVAWILDLAVKLGTNTENFQLIEIDHIGNGDPVFGTGEVGPEYLYKFADSAVPISKPKASDYLAAWDTYTSPTPNGLATFFRKEIESPNLRKAMKTLIGRYPSAVSGLSKTDESFLKYTAENGPRVVRVIGNVMAWESDGDRVEDLYLFWRLRKLACKDLTAPLLHLDGDPTSMRACEVSLTSFGEKVAHGTENAFIKNGIDDWIGGVHLLGTNPIAVRDGDQLKILG